MSEPVTTAEQEIAWLFGLPAEALTGAERHGLMRRLRYLLWKVLIVKHAQAVAADFEDLAG
ncbi:MAG TPA: hypothetical protein VM305_08250 [Candidatus Limnocylindrales bacterium]|nr:hypothetical protein [Candidatus Limnocylindrales bacterium]